jgi:hypothetical protein
MAWSSWRRSTVGRLAGAEPVPRDAASEAIRAAGALHRYAARLGFAMRAARDEGVAEALMEPLATLHHLVGDTCRPAKASPPSVALRGARPEVQHMVAMLAEIAGGPGLASPVGAVDPLLLDHPWLQASLQRHDDKVDMVSPPCELRIGHDLQAERGEHELQAPCSEMSRFLLAGPLGHVLQAERGEHELQVPCSEVSGFLLSGPLGYDLQAERGEHELQAPCSEVSGFLLAGPLGRDLQAERGDKHKDKDDLFEKDKDKYNDKDCLPEKDKDKNKDKDDLSEKGKYKDKDGLSEKDKDKYKDKDGLSEKDRHKYKDKDDLSEKDKHQDKDGLSEKDKDKHKDKDDLSEKDKDKYKDKDGVHEKDKDKHKDKDDLSEKGKDKYKDKDGLHEKDKHKHKDKDDLSEKDKHKYKNKDSGRNGTMRLQVTNTNGIIKLQIESEDLRSEIMLLPDCDRRVEVLAYLESMRVRNLSQVVHACFPKWISIGRCCVQSSMRAWQSWLCYCRAS